MRVHGDVNINFEKLARSTDEFNAAQLRAVCVEASMITLREGLEWLSHEHSHSGIAEGKCLLSLFKWPVADDIIFLVQSKRKKDLIHFA